MDLKALQANYRPTNIGSSAPQKKKKNPLTSFISEAGGTGGALGGAALGTAILPGIGTLLGAGLGGAAGAFGGRVAENEVRDQRLGLGDAAKEGAITGLLSAGPLKLLKAGGAAAGALRTGAEVAPAVEESLGKTILGNITGKAGQSAQRLEARAGGLGVGQKIAGKELTPEESSRLLRFAVNEGMPAGHPELKADFITKRLGQTGSAIEESIGQANRSLTSQEKTALANDLLGRVNSDVTLKNNPAAKRTLGELMPALQGVEDLTGANTAKRDIQSKINFIRKSSTPTPNREGVLNAAQQTLNNFVGGINPELKTLNTKYGDLSKVQEGLLGAAGKLSNTGEGGGGGLIARLAGGDIAQTGKSLVGRGGMSATNASPGAIRESLKYMTRALAGSGIANAGANQAAQQQQEQLPVNYQQSLEAGGGLGAPSASAGAQSQEQSVYPIQNALADIQKNPKYIDDIIKFYKFANPEQKANANIGKPSAQQYGLATSGLNAIDILGQQLAQDPSLLARSATPGQSLPLIGGLIGRLSGSGEYQATANNALDALARARTGAAMSSHEESFYRNFLPKAGDSQQTVNRKLTQLQQAFQPFLGQNSGSSSSEDVLSALGY